MVAAFGSVPRPAGYRSGDDVRQQLAFDLLDLVLQRQLAFLEPLQLKLVERAALDHARDHVIEVAVLGFQLGELRLEGFDVEIHRNSARPGASSLPAARRFGPRAVDIARIAAHASGGEQWSNKRPENQMFRARRCGVSRWLCTPDPVSPRR